MRLTSTRLCLFYALWSIWKYGEFGEPAYIHSHFNTPSNALICVVPSVEYICAYWWNLFVCNQMKLPQFYTFYFIYTTHSLPLFFSPSMVAGGVSISWVWVSHWGSLQWLFWTWRCWPANLVGWRGLLWQWEHYHFVSDRSSWGAQLCSLSGCWSSMLLWVYDIGEKGKMNLLILSNGLSQILMLNAISCIYSYIPTTPEIQLKPTVSLPLLPNQSTIAPCETIHFRNDTELIQHCM